jgi:hypothetical protein
MIDAKARFTLKLFRYRRMSRPASTRMESTVLDICQFAHRSGFPWTNVAARPLVLGVILSAATSFSAVAQSSAPDPRVTPGAVNPEVTQDSIQSTICVRGWTRTVRPDRAFTQSLKRQQVGELGYQDQRMSQYEEDHLIPLSLGGAASDRRNLWPEPRFPADGWNAEMKDELEAVLARLVCNGRVSLEEARAAFATNWRDAWNRYVGSR